MRAITASLTPPATTAMVRLDNFANPALAVQVVVSGGATFTMNHSNDDPNDTVNPIAAGSMNWQDGMFPSGAQSGSASLTFGMLTAPLWIQLNLTNATGSVRATFLQVGVHAHSNIAGGPFVPLSGGEPGLQG